jgi:hypothetical protein
MDIEFPIGTKVVVRGSTPTVLAGTVGVVLRVEPIHDPGWNRQINNYAISTPNGEIEVLETSLRLESHVWRQTHEESFRIAHVKAIEGWHRDPSVPVEYAAGS